MTSPYLLRPLRTEADVLAARRTPERGVKTLAEALKELPSRCPKCHGTGLVALFGGCEPYTCPYCDGTGKREEEK